VALQPRYQTATDTLFLLRSLLVIMILGPLLVLILLVGEGTTIFYFFNLFIFLLCSWSGCCTVPSCDVVILGEEFSGDMLLSTTGDCGRAYLWGGADPAYLLSDTLLLNYNPPVCSYFHPSV
jgi:hypothetical protein